MEAGISREDRILHPLGDRGWGVEGCRWHHTMPPARKSSQSFDGLHHTPGPLVGGLRLVQSHPHSHQVMALSLLDSRSPPPPQQGDLGNPAGETVGEEEVWQVSPVWTGGDRRAVTQGLRATNGCYGALSAAALPSA